MIVPFVLNHINSHPKYFRFAQVFVEDQFRVFQIVDDGFADSMIQQIRKGEK